MPNWPPQVLQLRLYLPAAVFLASVAYGAEPELTPVPPHPLVTAAEALYQRGQFQACDELMKQAAMAPGLTDDDLVRLQLLTALRAEPAPDWKWLARMSMTLLSLLTEPA